MLTGASATASTETAKDMGLEAASASNGAAVARGWEQPPLPQGRQPLLPGPQVSLQEPSLWSGLAWLSTGVGTATVVRTGVGTATVVGTGKDAVAAPCLTRMLDLSAPVSEGCQQVEPSYFLTVFAALMADSLPPELLGNSPPLELALGIGQTRVQVLVLEQIRMLVAVVVAAVEDPHHSQSGTVGSAAWLLWVWRGHH